jgi:hypothetical protein
MGTPLQGHASPFARGLGKPEHESPAAEYTAAKEQLRAASAAALAATDAYRAPEPLASAAKAGPDRPPVGAAFTGEPQSM